LDTSVALKWYVEKAEADVAKAIQLLEAFGRGLCSLTVPQLLLWEIANALAIGHRLKVARVSEALAHLRSLDLDLRSLQWSTLESAVEIASASESTVYDAYFLALALESNSLLVTADEKFLRKTHRYRGIVSLNQLELPWLSRTNL
jgi:predicted nucleic acid-binding protein